METILAILVETRAEYKPLLQVYMQDIVRVSRGCLEISPLDDWVAFEGLQAHTQVKSIPRILDCECLSCRICEGADHYRRKDCHVTVVINSHSLQKLRQALSKGSPWSVTCSPVQA